MDNKLIPISAIGAATQEEPIYMTFGDVTVEIRRAIPYTEVLDMIQLTVDFAVTDQPILSGALSQMVKDFAIVKFYTNLDVSLGKETATIEGIYNEYNTLMTFGVIDEVKSKISPRQLKFFNDTVAETAQSILAYRNSIRGILDSLGDSAKTDSDQMQRAIDMLSGENGEKLGKLIDFAETIRPQTGPSLGSEG